MLDFEMSDAGLPGENVPAGWVAASRGTWSSPAST